jgi:hypothetical protein
MYHASLLGIVQVFLRAHLRRLMSARVYVLKYKNRAMDASSFASCYFIKIKQTKAEVER